ncbi:MAG TPA: PQQ-binding-like beta-propeller repeat protein, partial [Phycisphaerales bacterium]|nr:PQQ-binding-like beta-propeller repeat protein [Phycisphaerales bacterium]
MPTDSHRPLDSILSATLLRQSWRQTDAGTVILFALLAAIVLWCLGCSNGTQQTTSSSQMSSAKTQADPEELTAAEMKLEREYAIGPVTARNLEYRIDWQYTDPSGSIKDFWVQDDSVFLVDDHNNLTRVRREEGDRLWRLPVAGPIDEICGIRYMPNVQRVAVITGGHIYIHDSAGGSMLAKQMLQKIAATNALAFGPYLIYGARSGEVMWQAYAAGSEWRGFKVAHAVEVAPILDDNYVITVGNDGNLVILSADSAHLFWSHKMQDDVVASPAVGNDAVYIASLDQHLRGYDLPTGRKMWDVLFDQPLRDN